MDFVARSAVAWLRRTVLPPSITLMRGLPA
jgi:hypothetical protein